MNMKLILLVLHTNLNPLTVEGKSTYWALFVLLGCLAQKDNVILVFRTGVEEIFVHRTMIQVKCKQDSLYMGLFCSYLLNSTENLNLFEKTSFLC